LQEYPRPRYVIICLSGGAITVILYVWPIAVYTFIPFICAVGYNAVHLRMTMQLIVNE